jgi:hypothetical protein
MSSNLQTLQIDWRSGSVVMRLASGETLVGQLPDWAGQATQVSQASSVVQMARPVSAPAPQP